MKHICVLFQSCWVREIVIGKSVAGLVDITSPYSSGQLDVHILPLSSAMTGPFDLAGFSTLAGVPCQVSFGGVTLTPPSPPLEEFSNIQNFKCMLSHTIYGPQNFPHVIDWFSLVIFSKETLPVSQVS